MQGKRTEEVIIAIGRIVIELASHDEVISRELIIEQLEFYRRISVSLYLKALYRDAAEMVRSGRL